MALLALGGGVIPRLRTLELANAQQKELVSFRDHDPRPDIRERSAAILKIAEGQAPYAVAQRGLLRPRDADTVYRWLNRYEQDGMEGLLNGRQGGNRRCRFRRSPT